MFHGVEPIKECFILTEFYHITEDKYYWPDIPESLGISYTYEVMQNE